MTRRLPGQSIRDLKEELMDGVFPFTLTPLLLWVLYGWEELHLRTHLPLQPQVLLFLAIAATGVAIIVLGRLRHKVRNLNRGEHGELTVAEALNALRASEYRVVHDITGNGYNIDHVVVGPSGVYAIETKFRSGSGQIEFRNGEGIFVGGHPEEKDSLKQARRNAGEVNRIIQENCGIYQWVKPLVVFVGNWKIRNAWVDTDARVFTPAQLVRYIANQQPELKRSEVKLIASHLDRSVRG